jgi:hypothetical protein
MVRQKQRNEFGDETGFHLHCADKVTKQQTKYNKICTITSAVNH